VLEEGTLKTRCRLAQAIKMTKCELTGIKKARGERMAPWGVVFPASMLVDILYTAE